MIEVATVLIRVVAAACEARQGELATDRSPRAPRQQHGAKAKDAKESKVQASGIGEEAVTCRRI